MPDKPKIEIPHDQSSRMKQLEESQEKKKDGPKPEK
jgi:hypothetical protein